MTDAILIIQAIVTVAFVFLAARLVADRIRTRDRGRGLLATSIASLAAAFVIGRVNDATDVADTTLTALAVVAVMASAACLWGYRDTVVPVSTRARAVVGAALGIVTVAGVAARLPSGQDAVFTGPQLVVVWAIVLTWSAVVLEPVARFWHASRGLPTIQRARLRSISLAYGGIAGLLVIAMLAASGGFGTPVRLVLQVGTLFTLVPLYAGFATPRWLRRLWRGPEERQLRIAMREMLHFSTDRPAFARHALGWGLRIVGADVGVMVDPDGAILARAGDRDPWLEAAAERPAERPGLVALRRPAGARAIVVPLRLRGGIGILAVRAGRFTPAFGDDEVDRLADYGDAVAVALDRVELAGELEEETRFSGSLIRAISDLDEACLVVEDVRLVWANDAYMRITGYTLEELRALPSLVSLAAEDARADVMQRVAQRRSGASIEEHFESALLTKDGRRVDVEVAIKAMDDDRDGRVLTLIRDVTERKRGERELHRLDAMRGAFIANAAHELRTPLTVVTGVARTLAAHRGMPRETVDESLRALARQTGRIHALIDDLLDLSRLDTTDEPPDEGIPALLAVKGALEAAPPPEGVRVGVHGADTVQVLADAERLERALVNLLTNAYRYGGPNVVVTVTADRECARIVVADDGPGVPQPLVPHLFDAFTRGPHSRRTQGSGLGLAIVRRIAESLGGSAAYHPAPEGARFVLDLRSA